MEELNLQDANAWSDKLLERIPGTEFLKLNVVAGGDGGGPFDAIQDLSLERNIPLLNLQFAKIQIGLEGRENLTKFIRMEFRNLQSDDDDPSRFPRTSSQGHDHTHWDINDYDVLENRILRISGTWGSYYGPHILCNFCIECMNIKLENGEEIQRGNDGMPGTHSFNICAPQDFYIANIYGRSGWSLDQIGVYLKTDRPLEWSFQAHFQFPELFKKQVRTFLLCVGRMYQEGAVGGTGSQDVIQKIVQNMLLKCGMTVEQYREMASNLVFNERIFRDKFDLEQLGSSVGAGSYNSQDSISDIEPYGSDDDDGSNDDDD
eukprot:TRINITY_DN12561_c0_g1_i1.p1 TRINITY_DN12561_c0_g1~~TRINITY_DN12561_c0_g1_i1.p1  ORF type:complete len:318 (+),score=46.11 TRINITY_DN12561_c0_g1_i1:224-1177(+)